MGTRSICPYIDVEIIRKVIEKDSNDIHLADLDMAEVNQLQ